MEIEKLLKVLYLLSEENKDKIIKSIYLNSSEVKILVVDKEKKAEELIIQLTE